SSRRRHTRFKCDWSSDVCSSDLGTAAITASAAASCACASAACSRQDRLNRRSEERRVGKECRSRGSPYHYKKHCGTLRCRYAYSIVRHLREPCCHATARV